MSVIENIRKMREKEKRGESIERTPAPDPMIINEDENDNGLMAEMVENQQGDSDFPAPLDADGTPGAAKGNKDDSSLADVLNAESTEKELDTSTPLIAATGTEDKIKEAGAVGKTPIIDLTTEHEFETVYGKEKLSTKDLIQGYMRTADYTQKTTQLSEQRKLINHLLSDPKNLVEYAVDRGMDLKQFVTPEPVVQTFELPELDYDASPTEKALHNAAKVLMANNAALASQVSGIQKNIKVRNIGAEEEFVKREFAAKHGDIPDQAIHAVYALYRDGQNLLGKGYGVQNAINDYKIAEGNIEARFMASSKGVAMKEQIRRQAIKDYLDGKATDKAENISPDSMSVAKKEVPAVPKPKIHSIADARAAIKRNLGF